MDCNPQPAPPLNNRVTLEGMERISSLCSTGPLISVLTGAFVAILRDHFSNPNNLEFGGTTEFREVDGSGFGIAEVPLEQLQRYIWKEDRRITNILIDPVWKYNREDIQRRPGLLVKRNQWTTQKVAIGDGHTIASGGNGRVEGRYQTRLIVGSHTVFCIGGSAAEAELLASEVFGHFMGFAQVVREELKLHSFEVQSIEAVSHFEEHNDKYVVPVVLGYTSAKAWRTDVVAPYLKAFTIDALPAGMRR